MLQGIFMCSSLASSPSMRFPSSRRSQLSRSQAMLSPLPSSLRCQGHTSRSLDEEGEVNSAKRERKRRRRALVSLSYLAGKAEEWSATVDTGANHSTLHTLNHEILCKVVSVHFGGGRKPRVTSSPDIIRHSLRRCRRG